MHEDLVRAGVRVHGRVLIQSGVWVDLEWGWLIEIGERVILAPQVMVFAHDASTRRALGYTKVAPVVIGDRVYVGGGSIVLPGVTIGHDAIIGAGSIVTRDIPAEALAAGNPARVLSAAEDYLDRRRAQLQAGPVFDDARPEQRDRSWPARRDVYAEAVKRAGVGWVR